MEVRPCWHRFSLFALPQCKVRARTLPRAPPRETYVAADARRWRALDATQHAKPKTETRDINCMRFPDI